jgi:hypothetical protein
MSIRRRVRAYTRLLEATKALTPRDYVRGNSRLSTLFNSFAIMLILCEVAYKLSVNCTKSRKSRCALVAFNSTILIIAIS